MTLSAVAPLLAALLAAPVGAGDAAAREGVALAQATLTVRQRLTIRVPLPPPGPPAPVAMPRWREKRGPECIAMAAIAGAAIVAEDSVDIILRGGLRLRAKLESACPALDYYRGFYLRPTADGRVCADRDAIHARSGGECGIDQFRILRVARRR